MTTDRIGIKESGGRRRRGRGRHTDPVAQSHLGHLGYHKRHLDPLVDIVARGRLGVSRSIRDILPLEDVAAAWSG